MRALNSMEVEKVSGGVGQAFGWTIWQNGSGSGTASGVAASDFTDGAPESTPRIVITGNVNQAYFDLFMNLVSCGFSTIKGGKGWGVVVECGPAALDVAASAQILLRDMADQAIGETLNFIRNTYGPPAVVP